MMLSDRSQTQRPHIVTPFIRNVQNRQLHSNKVDGWLPGAVGRGTWQWLLTSRGFLLRWWQCSGIRWWRWLYNLRTCQNPLDVFTECKLQLSYFKRMKGTTKEQHIFGDFLSRLLAYAVNDHRDRRGARDFWIQGGTQLQLRGAASVLHPRATLGWAPPCPWCQVALRPHSPGSHGDSGQCFRMRHRWL